MIDYAGSIDGVAFEGGTAENHPLEIGSNSFIPGFEDQLIGKNIGDEVDVNVTFPEETMQKTLPANLLYSKLRFMRSREKKFRSLMKSSYRTYPSLIL